VPLVGQTEVERAFEEYNLRGGSVLTEGDKSPEQIVREMAREDVSGYPDDTQKIQDAYDEATDRLKTIQQEVPTDLPDGESIQTEPISEKLLNFGDGLDERTLVKAAVDGNASVAGAENTPQQLKKHMRVWKLYGVKGPGFLKWFGDWLAPTKKQKLLALEPTILKLDKLPESNQYEISRLNAISDFSKIEGTSVVNIDDGKNIKFVRSGIDKTLSHSDGSSFLNWRIVSYLPELLKKAVLLTSDIGNSKTNNIDVVYRYASTINVDGKNHAVLIVVREMAGEKNSGYYYDDFVIDGDIKNITPTSRSSSPKEVTSGGDKFTLAQWLNDVNTHSVVVDADGAPLKVYNLDSSVPDVMPEGGFRFTTDASLAGEKQGYYLNARKLASVEQYGSMSVAELKAAGFDGALTAEGYEVFDRSQMASEKDPGTFSNKNPNALYQEGGDMPLFPVGGYDQMSGFAEMGNILHDGWLTEVKPLLDAMQDAAGKPEAKYNFAGMDEDTNRMFNQWVNQVRGSMAQTKHMTLGYADTKRDLALLPYGEQYGFDKLLGAYAPYQFYLTRTGFNWMVRIMDRPGYASMYARARQLQNTYKNQYPERMRNKIRIPMPFLEDWTGGGVWTNVQPRPSLFFRALRVLRVNPPLPLILPTRPHPTAQTKKPPKNRWLFLIPRGGLN
jgi:hypothetical protein